MIKTNSGRRLTVFRFLALVFWIVSPLIGSAGKLDNFEADAKSEKKSEPYHHHDHSQYDGYDLLFDALGDVLVLGLGYGGASSWLRISGSETDSSSPEIPPRSFGEPLIPFVRADVSYQLVESDVSATDYRLEVGVGPGALQVNATHYTEEVPDDTMRIVRWHGLYRMSFGPSLEIDMGAGGFVLDNSDRYSTMSFTTPIRYHPNPLLGIEFVPSWADNVVDYEFAVLMTARPLSIKFGYRWLRTPYESLDGPYGGCSLHF